MESVVPVQMCNAIYTCGIHHVCDVRPEPSSLLYNVISVFDKSILLKNVKKSQDSCTVDWYMKLKQSAATHGSIQYRDGILCKLFNDHFCPIIVDVD